MYCLMWGKKRIEHLNNKKKTDQKQENKKIVNWEYYNNTFVSIYKCNTLSELVYD